MQNARSVYLQFKKLKKKINYISIHVCQLVDCSKNVVAVILTASTRILNLNTVRDCRYRVFVGVVFSSAEWSGTKFRELASIFVPRNGIPSCFLFR
jgi:hypothetical protein